MLVKVLYSYCKTNLSEPKTSLTARMEGTTIILNCTVEADRHSIIDVMWTKDGKPINLYDEKSKYNILHIQCLSFKIRNSFFFTTHFV